MTASDPLPSVPPEIELESHRDADLEDSDAPSPLPEEPLELNEALDELESLAAANRYTSDDKANVAAARAALVALFDEQAAQVRLRDYEIQYHAEQAASLSSQLERAKKPNVCNVCGGSGKPASGLPCICGGVRTEQAELEGFRARCYDLESSLERLKAEQLTAEEARYAADCIDYRDGEENHPGAELLSRLRSLSQSDTADQPTEELKE